MATAKKSAPKRAGGSSSQKKKNSEAVKQSVSVLACAFGNNVRVPIRAYGGSQEHAIAELMKKEPKGGFLKEHGIAVRHSDGTTERVEF